LQPVRERGGDKVILARYFLNKYSRELNVNKSLTGEALEAIVNYDWPGNVREINHKIKTAVFLSSGSDITSSDLKFDMPVVKSAPLASLRDVRSTVERQKLVEALRICNNNISKTAKVLGISRPSVYSLKRKFGI
jgi:two-component system NtrC family response regulator